MPMINETDFCERVQSEIDQCVDEPQKLTDDFITAAMRNGEMDGYEVAITIVQEVSDGR